MAQIYPLYNVDYVATVRELLYHAAVKYKNRLAYKIPEGDDIREITFEQLKNDAVGLGNYLLSKGIYGGKHIALIGENSYEWLIAYFAVVCSGNVVVPLDNMSQPEILQNIYRHSDSEGLFYSKTHVDKLRVEIENEENFRVCLSDIYSLIDEGHELIKKGSDLMENIIISPMQLSTIIYTSGTMGDPKGVMLSHGNISENTVACCRNVHAEGETLAILPFYHSFSMTVGILSTLHSGLCTYISKSVRYISKDINTIKPTFLFLVPLVVDSIHKKIWDGVRKLGKEKQLRKLMSVSNSLLKVGIDVRRKLFKSVLENLGSHLEWISCGGAPVSPKVSEDFKAFGINIIEGYGLTECSPCVASNRNDYTLIGSVGRIVDGCEVKIDTNDPHIEGEVLVRGRNVMMGYYKNEEATREAFVDGGWFRTGDIGHLDPRGFLHITGRKKNMIILKNGKNIHPEEIEEYVHTIDEVEEVLVYAEDDYIVAEIYPMSGLQALKDAIDSKIKKVNEALPRYKQIMKVKYRQLEFDKTSTRKIKRVQSEKAPETEAEESQIKQ